MPPASMDTINNISTLESSSEEPRKSTHQSPTSINISNGDERPTQDAADIRASPQQGGSSDDVGSRAQVDRADSPSKQTSARGEKQVKPNKVYVGGLPEHTRQEDLQNCFGKIGNIVAIELKLGYGFVEFDSREAAEESVAKYDEGYFMGNKIRVEPSHGGGRTAKYSGEPGACFKCGQQGHWARECPTSSNPSARRVPEHHDRGPAMGPYPVPPRDYPSPRDDYGPSGRYAPPPREMRYGPDSMPPPPIGRDYRDYRLPRPLTPPRDYRDYSAGPSPLPVRGSRDYEEYRVRGLPPQIPPARYDGRSAYYPPPPDANGYREPPGYTARQGHGPPREVYDRRGPPSDRYPYITSHGTSRPRSPPSLLSRTARDEYERIPSRDYHHLPDYRGRMSSPRFMDDRLRYRRRSQSPIPSSRGSASGYPDASMGYSAGPPYGSASRSTRDDYRPSDRNGRA